MTNQPINNGQRTNATFELSKKNAWLLWCSQVINIVSLSWEISHWMLAILALCLGWQALLINVKANHKSSTVSPWFLTFFAVGGCIAIAITARSNGVLLSMIHLLSFAYVLKAFEIKQRKDFYQMFLLGLFLLATALIFRQNLAFSLTMLLALILNLVVLQQVFSPSVAISTSSKKVVVLLLQSALLAIVLFIVFPRLSPFWQVPSAQSAQTGLSDEVSPGDIANLALSTDLAFRVDFKDSNIPPYSQLYWRAMTLEKYNGRKWSRAKTLNADVNQSSFIPSTTGLMISYDVIVEPSFQSWLFGLTVATTSDPNLRLLNDYTMQSRTMLSQIKQYSVQSFLQAPMDITLSDDIKQRNLAISPKSNPRLEKLALRLKQQFPNITQRSNYVLALFKEQQYFYTLAPPLLTNNSLDQFFFDTKAGFCVHYASAYTYLMRASGVPARVVTGYLGGEYNKVIDSSNAQTSAQGGYLSIYQYDAHAWSEIWLAGKGWQRVDPTAAVDPQRVESGWSNTLLAQQSTLNNDLLSLYRFKRFAWLNTLRLKLDALDYQWTRWVLGYSNAQQSDLLNRWFGKNVPWKNAAIIAGSLIGTLLLLILFNRGRLQWFSRTKVEPWLALYQQLLKQLAKKGLTKPENITPSAFAQIVGQEFPALSADFTRFTLLLESLMYQPLNSAQHQKKQTQLQKCYDQLSQALQ